jgi:hypothetical protein
MKLTTEDLEKIIQLKGSRRAAASYLGLRESTFRSKIKYNRPIYVSEAIGEVWKLEEEIKSLQQVITNLTNLKLNKPRFIGGRDGVTRVVAIGDTHDQPNMDKERFKWIARHCVDVKPHRIIQIGDFCSWDSVSTHEQPGTIGHASRPSFINDLESCEEAMRLFLKEMGGLETHMELLAGNHEDRIHRFENKTPETVGALYMQFEQVCAQYRWRLHDYGHWLFVDGVGFTHVPKNIMGKPYGGQNSENSIANHATHSIVFGHTHRATFRKAPKIGINNSIEVLNLGSAMPDGYIAKYAGTATSGWSYGIFDLSIKGGHIVSHRFIDMTELREKYS